MKLHSILPLLLLLAAVRIDPPALEPRDVNKKMEEILEGHATYDQLTPELMGRALTNFVDQLDPAKNYLVYEQIEWALEPTEEQLGRYLKLFKKSDFSPFIRLYEEMEEATLRRNEMEARIDGTVLPVGVSHLEFRDPQWCHSNDELAERLLRLRALQRELAVAAEPEELDETMERIAKRRIKREESHFQLKSEQRGHQVRVFLLKALAGALDSQTDYYTPREAEQFLIQLQQRLSGIGVQLREGMDGFSILHVFEGGPAAMQGNLFVGDRVIAVDGETVVGMDVEDFIGRVRGEPGSRVGLTLLREVGKEEERHDERIEIEIVRDEVVFKEMRIESETVPFADGAIAHISLYSFYQDERYSAGSDLRHELEKLQAQHNLHGVILDLRNNSGGQLGQAIEVAGLFISKGIVASIRDNDGKVHYLRDLDGEVSWDGPLIVLVSRVSASAAEIVAQALQDYGRAIVVGDETTFGKGTYQTPTIDITGQRGFDPTGEYKVTRGTYYTVSGKSPQLHGVASDVVVPGPLSELEIGERFSKFPLEGGEIAANFHDDLSDVPLLHRPGIRKTYHFDLQPRLQFYTQFLDQLRLNSEQRIAANENYQAFLERLQMEERPEEEPNFGLRDLQLEETVEIMRDLVYLSNQGEAA